MLLALPERILSAVIVAETQTAIEMKQESIAAASGPYSQAQLTKAGHPYATRAPQTEAYPPQLINTQHPSGVVGSFVADPPVQIGRTVTTRCHNTDPKAKYLNGTPLMVARPLGAEVLAKIKARRDARLAAIPGKVLKF